jgi:ABC-type nitrate/sulfonate/bicarbonate transport system substrate-binding protein
MRRRAVWQAVAAATAALALAVTGCGGDGEEQTGGGGSSGGGGTTTLKVQETAGVPSAFVGFGISKGFFEKQGLKVELEATQGGAATVPALVSGDIQIGGSNVVSLLLAAGQGLPIQVIAPGTSARGEGEDDFGALLAGPDSGVEEARDFEGKTVAVNTLNNIAEVVVRESLEKEGADPSKVELTELPFPDMAAALDNGDVDGAFSIEPFVTPTVRDGAKIINYSYVVTEPDMQVGAYAVSRQYAEGNAEAVEKFRAAVAETAEYVTANQEEFRTFLSERAELDPQLAKRIVLPQFTTEVNVQSLENTAELMQKYRLLDEPVSVQELVGEDGG